MRQIGKLVLTNGHSFEGELIGAKTSKIGELVFTTSMVGYTEALTDPSYFGQIIVFAYPHIGNYGVPTSSSGQIPSLAQGFESERIHASGVVISSDTVSPSHWQSHQSLDTWLTSQGIPGITGIDTRCLVKRIRSSDRMIGKIGPFQPSEIVNSGEQRPESFPFDPLTHRFELDDPFKENLLPSVSCKTRKTFGKGKMRIGLIDCGTKWNIIRRFINLNCEVELLPWDTCFETVDCDAWVIGNGPGNPTETGDLVFRVKEVLKRSQPMLGICLGHQILALACGSKTIRLPYGHRSHNQPVVDEENGRAYMTSQNHGFVVCKNSLTEDMKIWFTNANDQSIEGLMHKTLPVFSVQFHPEASGGPNDTDWIFEKFISKIKTNAYS